jgi:hypothetical protein
MYGIITNQNLLPIFFPSALGYSFFSVLTGSFALTHFPFFSTTGLLSGGGANTAFFSTSFAFSTAYSAYFLAVSVAYFFSSATFLAPMLHFSSVLFSATYLLGLASSSFKLDRFSKIFYFFFPIVKGANFISFFSVVSVIVFLASTTGATLFLPITKGAKAEGSLLSFYSAALSFLVFLFMKPHLALGSSIE